MEKQTILFKLGLIEKLEPPVNLIIKVDFKGNNIGLSHIINSEKPETEVNWECCYELPELSEDVINDLVTHPFVFSVLHYRSFTVPLTKENASKMKKMEQSIALSNNSFKTKQLNVASMSIKRKKSQSSKTKSLSEDKANSSESFVLLGVATLDILPLLRGKGVMGEVLLLYSPKELRGSQAVAWTNLPRIEVTAISSANFTQTISNMVSNIMFFTVESLHKVTSVFLSGEVQIATILPHNFEVIKFTNSSIEVEGVDELFNRKKWRSLSEMSGPAAFSSYKISEDSLEHSMQYKLTDETIAKGPRVQWNQLQRSILTHEATENLKNKLISNHCWPLEIVVFSSSENMTDKKDHESGKVSSAKKRNETSKETSSENKHFLVFIDLTKLLYPGVTQCRVASQLYFYKWGLMESRFGSDQKMFELPNVDLPSMTNLHNFPKSVSSKVDSPQLDSPKLQRKEKSTINEELVIEKTDLPSEVEMVFNEEGEPVFIIVEVELLSPLIEKKSKEEVLQSIQCIIPMRPQPTESQQADVTSTELFETSIEQLMNVLQNEYNIFYSKNENASKSEMERNFLTHLHTTGLYTTMVDEILRQPVKGYIEEMTSLPQRLDGTRCEQQVLTTKYLSMVNKMCSIVNSVSQVTEYDHDILYKDLLYFALEAQEEGNPEKAKQYLLQRLERSKKADPQAWLDYAKLSLRNEEFDKAGECVREAICIDRRFIKGLLFQGLLFWLSEDFDKAEVFLLAVSSLDPHLLEGWIVLYMFHKQMDNHVAANTELGYGRKCVRGKSADRSDHTLSWSPLLPNPHRVFLVTSVLLLHLSFPELAEVALSYDLLENGRSIEYLYYLAVCHYVQGRYTGSLVHLEEAFKSVWEDGHLWALKGHNYYKLHKHCEAKQAFEIALNYCLPSSVTWLVYLRLGTMYCSEDCETAHQFFLRACQEHGSPLTWQGLGITAFMMDNLTDAELALSEANVLDCRMPRVWGYLALINLLWARHGVYKQCVSQTIRYGLDDPFLIDKLNVLGEYVQPTLI